MKKAKKQGKTKKEGKMKEKEMMMKMMKKKAC